jgi:3-deoxy-D-manno-oct-2-ulosonic acid (Kdo) hydroxylase
MTMSDSQIIEIPDGDWHGHGLHAPRDVLRAELERGKVLFFPNLAFEVAPDERRLFDPALADPQRKNISLAPCGGGAFVGVVGDADTQAAVKAMVERFQNQAHALIEGLLPEYTGKLRSAPTSLRLHQVETRHTSWRKDDSRLHIDAFPSRPNRGERILRVFVNVNPQGAPRVWRVGEPFEAVARRFVPKIKGAFPGSAWWLETLHITKSRRSEYDHLMLNLHDAMKADLDYQREAAQQTMPFPAGSTWVCFSDQTSHAVMAGQFMMEQTFFLAAADMVEPECAPLAVLERLKGHALV